MGAWGTGLFESDQDLDTAAKLSHEAGMCLESPEDAEFGGKGVEYTAKALNDGIFTRLFDKYRQPETRFAPWGNNYHLVILVALSMQLGANISDETKSYVRSVVEFVGLYKEGVIQFHIALDKYVDGVPYEFVSADVCEMLFDCLASRYYEDGILIQDLTRTMIDIMEKKLKCEGCGQTELQLGLRLKQCNKCKTAKYCCRKCQKKDWKQHKKVCGEHTNAQAKDADENKDASAQPSAT